MAWRIKSILQSKCCFSPFLFCSILEPAPKRSNYSSAWGCRLKRRQMLDALCFNSVPLTRVSTGHMACTCMQEKKKQPNIKTPPLTHWSLVQPWPLFFFQENPSGQFHIPDSSLAQEQQRPDISTQPPLSVWAKNREWKERMYLSLSLFPSLIKRLNCTLRRSTVHDTLYVSKKTL